MFFIINTFGGLLSSFLRSLGSAAIVMLLLIRMDRNIYMRGLERFDTGAVFLMYYIFIQTCIKLRLFYLHRFSTLGVHPE